MSNIITEINDYKKSTKSVERFVELYKEVFNVILANTTDYNVAHDLALISLNTDQIYTDLTMYKLVYCYILNKSDILNHEFHLREVCGYHYFFNNGYTDFVFNEPITNQTKMVDIEMYYDVFTMDDDKLLLVMPTRDIYLAGYYYFLNLVEVCYHEEYNFGNDLAQKLNINTEYLTDIIKEISNIYIHPTMFDRVPLLGNINE